MSMHVRASAAIFAFASVGAFGPAAIAEELRFMAELNGETQRPPVETGATGLADITVDTETLTVTWKITHQGLSGDPVAAHFHGPASPDETAPPVVDLGQGAYGATVDVEAAEDSGSSQTDSTTAESATTESTTGGDTAETVAEAILEGAAQFTEDQIADLRAGRYYINLHTEQHPEGEIRGQVVEGEADPATMQDASANPAATGEGAATAVAADAAAADVDAGEKLYRSTCRSCHGPRAQGMASFPKLTGRDVAYITDRLETYHAGETVGPNSKLMIPVAQKLSEDDITNVAAYIATAFD